MYRQQTGLPQHVLAGYMGVSLPTYRRVESGSRAMHPAELRAFCQHTRMDSNLLTDDSQPLPDPLPQPEPVPLTGRGRPIKPVQATPGSLSTRRAARIKLVIDRLFDGNARTLAQSIMTDETMLSRYLSGTREGTDKLLLRIYRNVPGVSLDWLRTGIGTMQDGGVSSLTVTQPHDGHKLDAYLLRQGITYADLASLSGKTYSTCLAYKRRVNIRYQTRQHIADALGVHVHELFPC